MPAVSKKQQKFMGMVHAVQSGELSPSKVSKKVKDVAKDMTKKDAEDFASTKHKGLPLKKEQSYRYGSGDIVKDVNPTCPHFGAIGKVKKVKPNSVVFVVTNNGKNFKPGQELEKSHDQMKKMNEATTTTDKSIGTKNYKGVGWFWPSALWKHYLRDTSDKGRKVVHDLWLKAGFEVVTDKRGVPHFNIKPSQKNKAMKIVDTVEKRIPIKESVKESINEWVEPDKFSKNFSTAMDLVIKQANNLKGPLGRHPVKRNVNQLKAVKTLFMKFIAPALKNKDRRLDKDFDLAKIKKDLGIGRFRAAIEYEIMNRLGDRSYGANSFFMLDDKEKKLLDKITGQLRKLVNKMEDAQLENINENKIYKVGDTVSLLSFDRRHRGKAKVKGVTKSRPNKFGIKNHYITNKGTFSDMEVEGTKAFKLRFKGNTEKQVTKAMQSPGSAITHESVNEDGHTDVASAKRKAMVMVDDVNDLLNKLNGMNTEDSLPSWLSDKITLSQNYISKAKDYLLNPVEAKELKEDQYTPHKEIGKRTQINPNIADYWMKILFDELPPKFRNVNGVKKGLRAIQLKYQVTDHSGVVGMYRMGKRKFMKDVVDSMKRLKEAIDYKKDTPKSLKKSNFKQLDILVPKGRVSFVMKALKKEVPRIKINHEEVDSYTKDGLIVSNFKKDDINKIMTIADHAGSLFESVNESYTLYHNGRPVTGFYTNAFPITKVVGTSTRSYISYKSEKAIKDDFKRVLSDVSKDDRFTKQDVQKLETMFKRMKIQKNESVNEMSTKSTKLVKGLNKKQKDVLLTMIDMQGFDNVMADYKRDKKAFKQALKDMSESINEDTYIGYYKNKKVKINAKSDKEAHKQIISKLKVPKRDYDIASVQNLTKTKKNIHKFESMNPSAIKKMRDEFEKTGDLPPHLKKFALDLKILKKKHKVKNIVVPGLEWMSDMKEQSVNEAKMSKSQAKELLQQLGGNKFIAMTGAKNLTFSGLGLVMKIGKNSKGVTHVRFKLSSMDLYDIEFLSIRANKVKIKSKEKGVYADQLGKMFKKNTGMNVRL